MSSIAEIHDNSIDTDNRLIYLHSEEVTEDYDGESGVDYRMATKFIKNMNYLALDNDSKPITIHMNTIGGDWNYGMAIYDTIMSCPCPVTIIGYSWARSMSSIILQAADERILMPSADFMVHFGTSGMDGHYLAVKSTLEYMNRTGHIMLDIYVNKCKDGKYFTSKNMNYKDVRSYIEEKIYKKSDWWLTAEEAVEYGFADKVGL